MDKTYELLTQYILDRREIEQCEIDYILQFFKTKKVKKNTNLLFRGEISNYLYFINKGVLRAYYITKFGNDSTRLLAIEGNFCGTLASFIQAKPSFEYIEAIEDCELLYISKKDFDHLVQKSPSIADIYRVILEEVQVFHMWRIESFISMDAQQRYQVLLKRRPEIAHRVSNKILASYLGIKPETLSRIKSNLLKS